MEAVYRQLNPIQGIRQQIGKDGLAVYQGLLGAVAVGIGTGDMEGGRIHLGGHRDRQLMGSARQNQIVNGLQIAGLVEPEAAAANEGQDQQHDQGGDQPLGTAPLFPLDGNGGRLRGKVIFLLVIGGKIRKGDAEILVIIVFIFFLPCRFLLRLRDRGGFRLPDNGSRGLGCGGFLGDVLRDLLLGVRWGSFGLVIRHLVRQLQGLRILCGRGSIHSRRGGRCLLGFVGADGRSGGRGDGDIVDGVALQVAHQCLAHLHRIGPAVGRVRIQGLHNDGSHLVVRIGGVGEGILGLCGGLRQDPFVVDLVQDHANAVGIHRFVENLPVLPHLCRYIGAAVLPRQGGVGQRFQLHKAQITDAELLALGKEHVAGLQGHIQIACPAADGQSGAKVKAQIHRIQIGHGLFAHIPQQRAPVLAEDVDLISQLPVFHGKDLAALEGKKALQLGKIVQSRNLGSNAVGHLFEIIHGLGRVFVSAGQQQCVQLHLGCRDGNDFHNVFFACSFLQGRTAADAVVVAHGVAHGQAVQQRRDKFLLRHAYRLLIPLYHKIKKRKKQQVCSCFMGKRMI